MSHVLRCALAALVVSAAASADAGSPAYSSAHRNDSRPAGTQTIEFIVERNGSAVGRHLVAFDHRQDGLQVVSTFNIDIDVLFLSVFDFNYRSVATWRDGKMVQLDVAVDDNGDRFSIHASDDGGLLSITGPAGRFAARQPLLPTNHWNAAVLGSSRVLNTLTGRINEVTLVAKGRDTVTTERGPVAATHYAYEGDLQTEVWYDDDGHWVKLRFKGRDGSNIEYRCVQCQGGPLAAAFR